MEYLKGGVRFLVGRKDILVFGRSVFINLERYGSCGKLVELFGAFLLA